MAAEFLKLPNMASYEEPTRHYVDLLMGVSWVEAGLGITMFLCQTITSWRYTQRFKADYWSSVLTLIISCISQAFLTYSTQWSNNFGNYNSFHVMKPLEFLFNFENGLKWGWLAIVTALVAITTGKLSIISFLDQVRGNAKASRPWFLWFIGLSNIIIDIAAVTLLLTQCQPVSKLWNISGPGVCTKRKITIDVAYLQGVWSAFSDFALAFYPITIIYNLQMRLQTKIGLCILMGFGVLAGVCAIIKTTYLNVLDDTANISYGVAPLIVTTMTEQWITLIVACVPPARPVIKSLFKKVQHNVVHNHHKAKGYTETPIEKATRLGQTPKRELFNRNDPNNTFHSLAYHDDTHEDVYEMAEHGSNENIVRDPKGIVMTHSVTVQITTDGKEVSNSEDGKEAVVYDRV